MRLPFIIFSFALATITAAAQLVRDPASPVVRGPYLQLGTPNSMRVLWRTDGLIDPVIRFGENPAKLDKMVGKSAVTLRQSSKTPAAAQVRKGIRTGPWLHSAPANINQYEAEISGLKPDTKYYYAVFDGRRRIAGGDESFYFRTHPIPGTQRSLRFWVVGDSGTGRSGQAEVHAAMRDLVRKQGRPLDLYIHAGDMAYDRGRDTEFQTRVFEMDALTLQNTVCWATMGNHEGGTSRGIDGTGPYYDAYTLPTRAEAGGLASGTEAFYSFDWGRVHFICLNSHDLDRKPTGAMAQWLKADLERTKMDWIIAYFHHPPYTKGSHDSDKESQLIEMRSHIMPILESGGVDVVLTGHSHIYERSMLMDGAYSTPTVAENVILDDGDGDPHGDGAYRKSAGIHPNEGAVQVVAGHGGAGLGRKGTMPVMKRVIVEHGSVIVDVEGDTLTALMLDKYGEQRDLFSIVKSGRVTPVRLANPRQLPEYKPVASKSSGRVGGEKPLDFSIGIPKHAEWTYLAGAHPATNWMTSEFNATQWKRGRVGIGHGVQAIETEVKEVTTGPRTIYLRRQFAVIDPDRCNEVGVMMDFNGAFVAYLNGAEVARSGVKGSGAQTSELKPSTGGYYAYFKFKDMQKYLRPGRNLVCIEVHGATEGDAKISADPWILIED